MDNSVNSLYNLTRDKGVIQGGLSRDVAANVDKQGLIGAWKVLFL